VYRAAGYAPSGYHEIELLVRFQITAHSARGYEVLFSITDANVAIVRWNGPLGSYASLGKTTSAVQDGDVIRVQMSGSNITVYKNGSPILNASDSTFTDGQPGMGFWPTDRGGVVLSSYGWRNYQAGDGTAP
jgi:hypothetical protein